MAHKRRWTDEQLREAVAAASSWAMVSRQLGLRSGATHYNVQKRTRELELDTSHFTSLPMSRSMTPWRDDELPAFVAASSSYPMVLGKLGLDAANGLLEKLRRRLKVLGISTQHFARTATRAVRATRWTDEALRAAVAASRSYAQVIRSIGLIPAGGNYDQVQRRITELGIDTSHFTGQGWNVGGMYKRGAVPLDQVLVSGRVTGSHTLKKRLFREGLKQPACEVCGWAQRAPDGRIPVELDHANGDKTDNRIENLRILCPNCHALQPTHRGLNQKRRRS